MYKGINHVLIFQIDKRRILINSILYRLLLNSRYQIHFKNSLISIIYRTSLSIVNDAEFFLSQRSWLILWIFRSWNTHVQHLKITQNFSESKERGWQLQWNRLCNRVFQRTTAFYVYWKVYLDFSCKKAF